MMQNIHKHSQNVQPTLGNLAYWSVTSAPMFGNDRSEISNRVQEGDGYA